MSDRERWRQATVIVGRNNYGQTGYVSVVWRTARGEDRTHRRLVGIPFPLPFGITTRETLCTALRLAADALEESSPDEILP